LNIFSPRTCLPAGRGTEGTKKSHASAKAIVCFDIVIDSTYRMMRFELRKD
jgi:hypothetical protein